MNFSDAYNRNATSFAANLKRYENLRNAVNNGDLLPEKL